MQSSGVLIFNFCFMRKSLHATVHDEVKELSVLCIFHDHEDVIGCFDDLVELCD